MTDEEFWQRVADNLNPNQGDDFGHPDQWDGPDLDAAMGLPACGVCGSDGACGYDTEGRPLIHATEAGD
jgi:hypothetical protein